MSPDESIAIAESVLSLASPTGPSSRRTRRYRNIGRELSSGLPWSPSERSYPSPSRPKRSPFPHPAPEMELGPVH